MSPPPSSRGLFWSGLLLVVASPSLNFMLSVTVLAGQAGPSLASQVLGLVSLLLQVASVVGAVLIGGAFAARYLEAHDAAPASVFTSPDAGRAAARATAAPLLSSRRLFLFGSLLVVAFPALSFVLNATVMSGLWAMPSFVARGVALVGLLLQAASVVGAGLIGGAFVVRYLEARTPAASSTSNRPEVPPAS